MKKLVSVTVIFCLLAGLAAPWGGRAEAAGSLAEEMDFANQEIGVTFPDASPEYYSNSNIYGNSINEATYTRMAGKGAIIFAYGSPSGGDVAAGPRVFGQTMSGDVFTNAKYPDDAWNASRPIADREWVKNPWENDACKNNTAIGGLWKSKKKNQFDAQSSLESAIVRGMEIRFPGFNASDSGKYTGNWHEYVKILQPPTSHSDGAGLMFHSDGAWYATISLPATAPASPCTDVTVAKIQVNGQDVKPGSCVPVPPGSTAEVQVFFFISSTSNNSSLDAFFDIKSAPYPELLATEGAISIPLKNGTGTLIRTFRVKLPATLKAGEKVNITARVILAKEKAKLDSGTLPKDDPCFDEALKDFTADTQPWDICLTPGNLPNAILTNIDVPPTIQKCTTGTGIVSTKWISDTGTEADSEIEFTGTVDGVQVFKIRKTVHLVPGATVSIPFEFPVPCVAGKTVLIGACVDPDNTIVESIETDNCKTVEIRITGDIDLSVLEIQAAILPPGTQATAVIVYDYIGKGTVRPKMRIISTGNAEQIVDLVMESGERKALAYVYTVSPPRKIITGYQNVFHRVSDYQQPGLVYVLAGHLTGWGNYVRTPIYAVVCDQDIKAFIDYDDKYVETNEINNIKEVTVVTACDLPAAGNCPLMPSGQASVDTGEIVIPEIMYNTKCQTMVYPCEGEDCEGCHSGCDILASAVVPGTGKIYPERLTGSVRITPVVKHELGPEFIKAGYNIKIKAELNYETPYPNPIGWNSCESGNCGCTTNHYQTATYFGPREVFVILSLPGQRDQKIFLECTSGNKGDKGKTVWELPKNRAWKDARTVTTTLPEDSPNKYNLPDGTRIKAVMYAGYGVGNEIGGTSLFVCPQHYLTVQGVMFDDIYIHIIE